MPGARVGRPSRGGLPVSTWLDANIAAMTSISPRTAARLETVANDVGLTVTAVAGGRPVLEWDGRALDSRRDPLAAAERAAANIRTGPVVVLGFGSGYFVEALLASGVSVAAVVEREVILRAALSVRDLSHVVGRISMMTAESLSEPGALARVRALAPTVVVHPPSVAVTPELGAIAERWARLPIARRPRVLVVGPVDGGSLGVARIVAAATSRLGADTRFFDASEFAVAKRALGEVPVGDDGNRALQGRLMLLLGEAIAAQARHWRADVLLALAQAPLAEPALSALRSAGITTAFWFVENTRVLQYWRAVAAHYDHFYAIQDGVVLEQIAQAGAAHVAYLPMACDPSVHAPLALTAGHREQYGSRVSFAGAPYLNRRHLIPALRDLGLKVWGEGWEQTTLADCLGATGRFDLDTMIRVFCASTINVNLHSAEHVTGLDPTPDYVNPRTFELAACGAFQLVDQRTPLPSLFAADEIAVFHSPAEMRALAEWYLTHEHEAIAMAERARARVLHEHTYEARIARILADTLAPHLQPALQPLRAETLDEAIARTARTPHVTEDEIYLRMVKDVRDTALAR